VEIPWSDSKDAESPLKLLWKHSDAILCCSLKVSATMYLALMFSLLSRYLSVI
jgi:homeobox-leucine zipper protein